MKRNTGNCSQPIEDLCDVNINSPQDGEVLVYSASNENWVNDPNTGSQGSIGPRGSQGSQGETGPSTVEDEVFTLVDTDNASSTYQFRVPNSGTIRVGTLPNANAFVMGIQTSNNFVFPVSQDMVFQNEHMWIGQDGDETARGRFSVSNIPTATDRIYTLPNADINVIGEASKNWSTTSLGITGASGSYDDILLQATAGVDRFFRFRSGGGQPNGVAGIMLSSFDSSNWSLFGNPATDGLPPGQFIISHNTSLPSSNNDLGRAIFGIDDTAGSQNVRFFNPTGSQGIALGHDVTNLTVSRTATWPDANTAVVGEANTQTLTNKTIDSTTNTVTADNLHSATTTIDVSSATAPSSGQVLTATSPTGATWQSTNATFEDLVFTLEDTDNPASTGQFRVPNSGTQRTWSLANDNYTLVGRTGNVWNTTSLDITGASGSYEDIRLTSSENIDRFFRFRSGGGGAGTNGYSGVMLSSFDGSNWSLFGNPGRDGLLPGQFIISHNTSLPSSNNDLGRAIFGIDDTAGLQSVRFFNPTGSQGIALAHDVTNLTSSRTATWPDANTAVVGEANTQTLTNKTIDSSTNTVTADNLHSATTTIDVSSATAPSSGQVLTATSPTGATWQSIANTAFITESRSFPDNTNEGTTTIGGLGASYMEITLFGGGGGGGDLGGGGGGSGGAVVNWPLDSQLLSNLSATDFSVIIGAGGQGAVMSAGNGSAGNPTTFISQDADNRVSLTAYGGGGGLGDQQVVGGGGGAGTGGNASQTVGGASNSIGGASGPSGGFDNTGGDQTGHWFTGWGGGHYTVTTGETGSNFFGRSIGGSPGGSGAGGAGGFNGNGGDSGTPGQNALANSGAGGGGAEWNGGAGSTGGNGGSGGAFIVWWT